MTTIYSEVTFYGWPDNDPPNSNEIAYPKSDGEWRTFHDVATTTKGYYNDPITLAAGSAFRKTYGIGCRIYIPRFRKYFVLEDQCASCTGNWVDLWIGGQGYTKNQVIGQEEYLTPDKKIEIIINPRSNKIVNTKPLMQFTRADLHY